MKKFIFKLTLFFSPYLIGIIFSFLIINVGSRYLVSNSSIYELDEKIHTLFAGDSRISLAVNENLIVNSKNISSFAEPYYYTFQKLKFYTSKSPIEKLVLGFYPSSLSDQCNEFLFGINSTYLADNFFFLLKPLEKVRVLYWNRKKLVDLTKRVHHSLYCHTNNINQKNNHLYDGFSNNFLKTEAKLERINKRINDLFYKNGSLRDFSKPNIEYFFKIIKLCQSRDIELILLTTPLSESYLNQVPKIYIAKYNKILSKSKLSHINLINDIDKNNLFLYDGDHVNKSGSKLTTQKVIQFLNNN